MIPMVDYLELLRILVSATAALATISATVYTWAWFKTKPPTWTLTGLTALLWSFALIIWIMRYVLAVDVPTDVSIMQIETFFSALVIVGYIMFLFGTYNSGPICKPKVK